ncbi:MAG TPA: hypothetical protein VGL80_15340 [Pseudonocardiaceae bacterium]|jgi:hypothetical protein
MADNTGAQAPDPATLAQIRSETAQANATASRNDVEDGRGGIDIRTAQARIHAAEVAEAAAVGSGFKFTPEQIETQLRQCKELALQYYQARGKAERAGLELHAPAPDTAGSVLQASQTQQSLANLRVVIQSQIDFLTKWQNTLTAVKTRYLQTEHLNETQWQQLARGLQA